MKNLKKRAIKIDLWLESHLGFCASLLLLTILRIPNFSEPYWYGDEGIYLTIGLALSRGARLYADIVDHKTPLIYYLAWGGDQFAFRILLYAWMIASTYFFYRISREIVSKSAANVATFIFVLLTSLPAYEGNIPNGELFVIGFMLASLFVLMKTSAYSHLFSNAANKKIGKNEFLLLYLGGIFSGIGLLTKVPALFDFAAFVTPLFFSLVILLSSARKRATLFASTKSILLTLLTIFFGFLTPLILSVLYFYLIGAGDAYLKYGLLYNFRYSGSWQPTIQPAWAAAFFSLKYKALILFGLFGVVTTFFRKLTVTQQFLLSWMVLALFATLLSNRPYPHYFLQLYPPLALLIGSVFQEIFSVLIKKKNKAPVIFFALAIITYGLFYSVHHLLGVYRYPTRSYYTRWLSYMRGSMDKDTYRQSFDTLMTDNYKAAEIIKKAGAEKLFIWGTNPMLFPLSETTPTGKYIVSFHIKDFKAQDESIDAVIASAPQFIVIMHNEEEYLPRLDKYLVSHYMPSTQFKHFTLWKRKTVSIDL